MASGTPSSLFSFGAPSTNPTTTTTAPPNPFSAQPSFSFSNPASSTPSLSLFSTPVAPAPAATTAPTSLFAFGNPTTTAAPAASLFSFGGGGAAPAPAAPTTTTTNPAPSFFATPPTISFAGAPATSAPAPSTAAPAFNFTAPAAVTVAAAAAPGFSFPAAAQPLSFAAPTTTATTSLFPSINPVVTSAPGPTPLFGFGTPPSTVAPALIPVQTMPSTLASLFPTITTTSSSSSPLSFLTPTTGLTASAPISFSTPATTSVAAPAIPTFGTPSTANSALANVLAAPNTTATTLVTTTAAAAPAFSLSSAPSLPSFSLATSSAAPTLLTSAATLPISSTTASSGAGLGGFFAPPSTTTSSSLPTSTSLTTTTATINSSVSIGKAKESSDPMDQNLPPQLNELVDQFIKMLAESEEHLSDMEHTSTSKFVNVQEQIGRIQQNLLDIQGDVQRDEATFAQINQAYQQELYNATICKYLRSLPLGAEIEDRVVDNYLMQKVEEIKSNYKQCQDVLDCAEKRLQTNGLGVTTEDLVATAKNVYTGMITAGSKANQTHKLVEDMKYRVLGHPTDV